MSRNPYANTKSYTRWSIRRLSVGVASVVVASGFFVLIGSPVVHADQTSVESSLVASSSQEGTGSPVVEESVPVSNALATTPEKEEGIATGAETVVETPKEVASDKNQGGAEASAMPETPKVEGEMQVESVTKPEEVKQAVAENIKESIDVPASYLEKAAVPGPFLAGVNQVIPYEAFGGDGMLTRLLLKASDKAPWSDNGVAKNPALLPLEKLGHGQYFYEVSLNGNTVGKDGQALLDQLRTNGTQAYMATVKVYAAKDGKPDLTQLVASRGVNVQLNGITKPEEVKQAVAENIKESIDVPASYLEKAAVPGPFLAGVNQVIPYEAFGGDGMLTRLLLKASDKAPWSDNGVAKNPALLPLEKLGHGQYFYEVSLNGNTVGKDGQALLDQLRANGTQAYMATVKVYAAKDGKPDLTQLVASREVMINLHKEGNSKGGEMKTSPSSKVNQKEMSMKPADKMADQEGQQMAGQTSGSQEMTALKTSGSVHSMMVDTPKATKMLSKTDKMALPNTGEATSHLAGMGVLGIALVGILAGLGFKKKEEKN